MCGGQGSGHGKGAETDGLTPGEIARLGHGGNLVMVRDLRNSSDGVRLQSLNPCGTGAYAVQGAVKDYREKRYGRNAGR
jgi:hypothetical protein